jgi:hypothetical protein
VIPSPAIGADGTIYVGSSGNNFYAINPDGTEKWHLSISDSSSSPAIGADGTIYVGTWDDLYAIGGPLADGDLENEDGGPDGEENEEGEVTPPPEGIPITYVITGLAVIAVAAGVVLVLRKR